MNEITFEQVKEKLINIENKFIYLHIKSFINSTIIIDKAKILINNIRMIITDTVNQDIEIDISRILKYYISVAENVFKFKIDEETEILLEIDKNS